MSEPLEPNPYLKSLSEVPLAAMSRRPVTINIDNPLNPATAYPSAYIGIDAKKLPTQGNFPAKMQNLFQASNEDLIAAALTPPPPRAKVPEKKSAPQSAVDPNLLPSSKSTSRKRAQPTTRKRKATKALEDNDSDGVDDDDEDFLSGDTRRVTSNANKKQKRKESLDDEGEDEYAPSPIAARTRSDSRKKDLSMSTPGAKTSAALVQTPSSMFSGVSPFVITKRKPKIIPVAKTLQDAGPGDRMIWKLKNEGKGWKEIDMEWERITGRKPGKSTLSVRWMKICTNFAVNGGADDAILIQVKNEADREIEIKLWELVATKILVLTGKVCDPETLRKRYNVLKDNDFQLGAALPVDTEQSDGMDVTGNDNLEDEETDIEGDQAHDGNADGGYESDEDSMFVGAGHHATTKSQSNKGKDREVSPPESATNASDNNDAPLEVPPALKIGRLMPRPAASRGDTLSSPLSLSTLIGYDSDSELESE